MAEPEPFTLRWGILSCGGIAKTFTKDLISPIDRGVSHEINHVLTAVATSNSVSRAVNFLSDIGCTHHKSGEEEQEEDDDDNKVKAHGSYEALVNDTNVDIIYIATPHSHHYVHARLALEAGKHVLCEKAFTVNAAQTRELVRIAQEKRLFLMEAVWTRCFPFMNDVVLGVVQSREFGTVVRVVADLSFDGGLESLELSNRLVNMDLAGGALLDIGIYSITWIFLILYHIVPKESRQPPSVASLMTKFHTGADETTSIIMKFGESGTHGIATCSLRVDNAPEIPTVTIQSTHGDMQLYGPAFKPDRYVIVPSEIGMANGLKAVDVKLLDVAGVRGMVWEADEAARCIRDGKVQSEVLDWEESIAIMDVMDQVRKQNGLVYPDDIESLAWPPPKSMLSAP